MTREVEALRPVLDLIYAGEGGPDSYNRGRAGDSPGPFRDWRGVGLQFRTLADIRQLQASGQVFAVGKPQIIPATMPLAIRASGLDLGDRFTSANQDRLAVGLILRGIRRRLSAYLQGRSADLDAAQTDLALEWASIPLPNGRGAYDGLAGNRANPAKAQSVRQALMQARANLLNHSSAMPTTDLVGPRRHPREFGFKAGDHHLVVNDHVETCKAFAHNGRLLWEVPALARGQGGDREWNRRYTDTPPGLYRVGTVYRDWDRYGQNAPDNRDTRPYGWFALDLIDLEGQEAANGRSGIMIHGGGSALGWPGAWAARQPLVTTQGCIRMHNIDLRDKVMPLLKSGTLFVSVYQEA